MKRQRNTEMAVQTNAQVQTRLNVLSELVNRANLASRLGTMTYGGDRDMYQALGYPTNLNFIDHFLPKYLRHDIAKAIIDRPVRAAWRGDFTIQEKGSKGKKSDVEKAWDELKIKFKLHTIFMRIDKLTGIGRYGVLFLGLNDVQTNDDLVKPVMGRSNKLVFIKPLSEGSAKIASYESDPNNKRYGQPLLYNIAISTQETSSTIIPVHHSRIIHITEDLLEDEVMGTPRLEAVFNRLLDLEKIIGGDAEMYWRGARPGFQGKVDKDFTLTPDSEKGLQDQFDEYENKLRRFLLMEGVDVKEFAQQIGDPSKNVDVQISMISAEKGIPKRVLMGSERGELSSAQDREEWNLWVQSRREEFMEPMIVRPVVDRFMEIGVLTKVSDYIVHWDEMFAMSPTEKSEIAEKFSNAIRYYTATPAAEYIVPKRMFLKKFIGFTDEELEEAEELVNDLPEIEPPLSEREAMEMQAEFDAKKDQVKVGADIKRKRKDPMAGTGVDTVAKKQKA